MDRLKTLVFDERNIIDAVVDGLVTEGECLYFHDSENRKAAKVGTSEPASLKGEQPTRIRIN